MKKTRKPIYVGVVGSRRRNTSEDRKLIKEEIKKFIERYGKSRLQLVSGGAKKGADKFAEEIADFYNITITIHYPDMERLALLGRELLTLIE